MFIIIDKKMPAEAKNKLKIFGSLIELETSGIVYPSISGHPDIFICETKQGLVVAPNLPINLLSELANSNIPVITGETPVENVYPLTAHYNAVATEKFFIHNLRYSDPKLSAFCKTLQPVNVKQGYTRCNVIALDENLFITSDQGVHKTLLSHGFNSNYFSPSGIQLDGFVLGFLGGTCGVWDRKIFLCGSLKYHQWGNEFRNLAESLSYSIIELADMPLHDVGSILFVEPGPLK